MNHRTGDAGQCRYWSIAVQRLIVTTVFALLGIGALLLRALIMAGDEAGTILFALLLLSWVLWAALQWSNFKLVRFGPQSARFTLYPGWINRPSMAIRLVNHLVVNWSAIGATLASALLVSTLPFRRELAILCALTAVVTWIGFNLQHKQYNRTRNLVMSTTIAGAVLSAAAWVSLS